MFFAYACYCFAVVALIGTDAYPGTETWGAAIVFAVIGAIIHVYCRFYGGRPRV